MNGDKNSSAIPKRVKLIRPTSSSKKTENISVHAPCKTDNGSKSVVIQTQKPVENILQCPSFKDIFDDQNKEKLVTRNEDVASSPKCSFVEGKSSDKSVESFKTVFTEKTLKEIEELKKLEPGDNSVIPGAIKRPKLIRPTFSKSKTSSPSTPKDVDSDSPNNKEPELRQNVYITAVPKEVVSDLSLDTEVENQELSYTSETDEFDMSEGGEMEQLPKNVPYIPAVLEDNDFNILGSNNEELQRKIIYTPIISKDDSDLLDDMDLAIDSEYTEEQQEAENVNTNMENIQNSETNILKNEYMILQSDGVSNSSSTEDNLIDVSESGNSDKHCGSDLVTESSDGTHSVENIGLNEKACDVLSNESVQVLHQHTHQETELETSKLNEYEAESDTTSLLIDSHRELNVVQEKETVDSVAEKYIAPINVIKNMNPDSTYESFAAGSTENKEVTHISTEQNICSDADMNKEDVEIIGIENVTLDDMVNPDVDELVEDVVNPDVDESIEDVVNPDIDESIEDMAIADVDESIKNVVNPDIDKSIEDVDESIEDVVDPIVDGLMKEVQEVTSEGKDFSSDEQDLLLEGDISPDEHDTSNYDDTGKYADNMFHAVMKSDTVIIVKKHDPGMKSCNKSSVAAHISKSIIQSKQQSTNECSVLDKDIDVHDNRITIISKIHDKTCDVLKEDYNEQQIGNNEEEMLNSLETERHDESLSIKNDAYGLDNNGIDEENTECLENNEPKLAKNLADVGEINVNSVECNIYDVMPASVDTSEVGNNFESSVEEDTGSEIRLENREPEKELQIIHDGESEMRFEDTEHEKEVQIIEVKDWESEIGTEDIEPDKVQCSGSDNKSEIKPQDTKLEKEVQISEVDDIVSEIKHDDAELEMEVQSIDVNVGGLEMKLEDAEYEKKVKSIAVEAGISHIKPKGTEYDSEVQIIDVNSGGSEIKPEGTKYEKEVQSIEVHKGELQIKPENTALENEVGIIDGNDGESVIKSEVIELKKKIQIIEVNDSESEMKGLGAKFDKKEQIIEVNDNESEMKPEDKKFEKNDLEPEMKYENTEVEKKAQNIEAIDSDLHMKSKDTNPVKEVQINKVNDVEQEMKYENTEVEKEVQNVEADDVELHIKSKDTNPAKEVQMNEANDLKPEMKHENTEVEKVVQNIETHDRKLHIQSKDSNCGKELQINEVNNKESEIEPKGIEYKMEAEMKSDNTKHNLKVENTGRELEIKSKGREPKMEVQHIETADIEFVMKSEHKKPNIGIENIETTTGGEFQVSSEDTEPKMEVPNLDIKSEIKSEVMGHNVEVSVCKSNDDKCDGTESVNEKLRTKDQSSMEDKDEIRLKQNVENMECITGVGVNQLETDICSRIEDDSSREHETEKHGNMLDEGADNYMKMETKTDGNVSNNIIQPDDIENSRKTNLDPTENAETTGNNNPKLTSSTENAENNSIELMDDLKYTRNTNHEPSVIIEIKSPALQDNVSSPKVTQICSAMKVCSDTTTEIQEIENVSNNDGVVDKNTDNESNVSNICEIKNQKEDKVDLELQNNERGAVHTDKISEVHSCEKLEDVTTIHLENVTDVRCEEDDLAKVCDVSVAEENEHKLKTAACNMSVVDENAKKLEEVDSQDKTSIETKEITQPAELNEGKILDPNTTDGVVKKKRGRKKKIPRQFPNRIKSSKADNELLEGKDEVDEVNIDLNNPANVPDKNLVTEEKRSSLRSSSRIASKVSNTTCGQSRTHKGKGSKSDDMQLEESKVKPSLKIVLSKKVEMQDDKSAEPVSEEKSLKRQRKMPGLIPVKHRKIGELPIMNKFTIPLSQVHRDSTNVAAKDEKVGLDKSVIEKPHEQPKFLKQQSVSLSDKIRKQKRTISTRSNKLQVGSDQLYFDEEHSDTEDIEDQEVPYGSKNDNEHSRLYTAITKSLSQNEPVVCLKNRKLDAIEAQINECKGNRMKNWLSEHQSLSANDEVKSKEKIKIHLSLQGDKVSIKNKDTMPKEYSPILKSQNASRFVDSNIKNVSDIRSCSIDSVTISSTHTPISNIGKIKSFQQHDKSGPQVTPAVSIVPNNEFEPNVLQMTHEKKQPVKLKITKNSNTITASSGSSLTSCNTLLNKPEITFKQSKSISISNAFQDFKRKSEEPHKGSSCSPSAWSAPDILRVERLLKESNVTITAVGSSQPNEGNIRHQQVNKPTSLPIVSSSVQVPHVAIPKVSPVTSAPRVFSSTPVSSTKRDGGLHNIFTTFPFASKDKLHVSPSAVSSDPLPVISPTSITNALLKSQLSSKPCNSKFISPVKCTENDFLENPKMASQTNDVQSDTLPSCVKSVDVKSEIRKKIASSEQRKQNLINETISSDSPAEISATQPCIMKNDPIPLVCDNTVTDSAEGGITDLSVNLKQNIVNNDTAISSKDGTQDVIVKKRRGRPPKHLAALKIEAVKKQNEQNASEVELSTKQNELLDQSIGNSGPHNPYEENNFKIFGKEKMEETINNTSLVEDDKETTIDKDEDDQFLFPIPLFDIGESNDTGSTKPLDAEKKTEIAKGKRGRKRKYNLSDNESDQVVDPILEMEEIKRIEDERIKKEMERERKLEMRKQRLRERNEAAKQKRLRQKMRSDERQKKIKENKLKLQEEKKKLEEEIRNLPPSLSSFDDETRMSADNSLSQTTINVADGIGEDESCSGATNESIIRAKKSRMDISELDSNDLTVDQIAEYQWPIQGGELYMIQEQITSYLSVKSFKRKYPDIKRRSVDSEERAYLVDSGLVSERMCELGLTAVHSSEILDIMFSDFPDKYEELRRYMREKQAQELSFKQKAWANGLGYKLLMADGTKQDLKKRAMESASNWNSALNKSRKDDRRCVLDLQTYIIHYPRSETQKTAQPSPKPGSYPISILPGQFSDYYRAYTPNEMRYLPLNTVLYGPIKHPDPSDINNLSDSDDSSSDSDDSSSTTGSTSSEGAQNTAEDITDEKEKELTDAEQQKDEVIKQEEQIMENNFQIKLRNINGNQNLNENLNVNETKILNESTIISQNQNLKVCLSPISNISQVQSINHVQSVAQNLKFNQTREVRVPLLCKMCNGDVTCNRDREPEVLIRCFRCLSYNHPTCLELTLEMLPYIRNYNWHCTDCKVCLRCKEATNEDKMLFCDLCDRGYHIYCVGLRKVPISRWHCQECAKCDLCGTKNPGGFDKSQWYFEYKRNDKGNKEYVRSLCLHCGRKVEPGIRVQFPKCMLIPIPE